MRRLILTATAIMGLASASANAQLDAKESFEQRQDELIELARSMGELHRLHQLCERRGNSNLFRVRMQELIGVEAPIDETRLAMVAAFNAGYRDGSQAHLVCSSSAQAAYKSASRAASTHVQNLASPM